MFVIQRDRSQIFIINPNTLCTSTTYIKISYRFVARHFGTKEDLGRSFTIIKQKPWKSERLIRFSFSHVKGSSGSKCCNTFCLDVLLVILSCLCILLWWWMFIAWIKQYIHIYIDMYVMGTFFSFWVHGLSENIFSDKFWKDKLFLNNYTKTS